MENRRSRGPFNLVLLLLLIGATWAAFAPRQLGGRATYAILVGSSMEPRYQRGDLIVARQARDYQVGEAVVYLHPTIGVVFHRIVAIENGFYILKGDANTWIDSGSPSKRDILGTLWLHLPRLGELAAALRAPEHIAALTFATTLLAIPPVALQRKRKRGRTRLERPREQRSDLGLVGPRQAGAVLVAGLIFLASLALGVISFAMPMKTLSPTDIRYQLRGEFAYSAAVPPGIYDSHRVRSGEPVFLRLSDDLDVAFSIDFRSAEPFEIAGTYSLIAQLWSANGWSRTLLLQPETPFAGQELGFQVSIHLPDLQSLLVELEQMTGLRPGAYELAIQPRVHLRGRGATAAFERVFDPRLTFRFDEVQLQLIGSEGSDPLRPATDGAVQRWELAPNQVSILGLDVKVDQARAASLAGLVLSATLALGLITRSKRAARHGEAAHIRHAFGHLLMDVKRSRLPRKPMVQATSFLDLARAAEQLGCLILHQERQGTHEYFLMYDETLYHYRSNGSRPSDWKNPRPASNLSRLPIFARPELSEDEGPVSRDAGEQSRGNGHGDGP